MLTLEDQFQVAKQFSVESHGKAVVYSGNQGLNRKRALNYSSRIPLDHTDAGRRLDGIYQLNNQRYGPIRGRYDSDSVMSQASHRYISNARGDIKTFVCGSDPNSVFRKTELSRLANNKYITSINGFDRKFFHNALKQDPSGKRAYRMVCLAELRQARREAKGNIKLLADVKARQGLYEAHKKIQFGKTKTKANIQSQNHSKGKQDFSSNAPKKSSNKRQSPTIKQTNKR